MSPSNWSARTTIRELRAIGHDNIIVNQFLKTWENGGFRSFEECLVSMCCFLANQNNEPIKSETQAFLMSPPSFIPKKDV